MLFIYALPVQFDYFYPASFRTACVLKLESAGNASVIASSVGKKRRRPQGGILAKPAACRHPGANAALVQRSGRAWSGWIIPPGTAASFS
jgi:hypothetical protein